LRVIAIEGIDAAGKNSLATALTRALANMGYVTCMESFPRYNSKTGKWIKESLTCHEDEALSPFAHHMLMEVDKYDFAWRMAEMEDGFDFLILDRWTLSNQVFAMAKGIDVEWVKSIQAGLPKADFTFFLDISVAESFRRRPERRDRIEQDYEYLAQVRDCYLRLVTKYTSETDDLYAIINGMQSPDEVLTEVLAHIHLAFLTPPELADSDVGENSVSIFTEV
jgi:dTMP kinase